MVCLFLDCFRIVILLRGKFFSLSHSHSHILFYTYQSLQNLKLFLYHCSLFFFDNQHRFKSSLLIGYPLAPIYPTTYPYHTTSYHFIISHRQSANSTIVLIQQKSYSYSLSLKHPRSKKYAFNYSNRRQ